MRMNYVLIISILSNYKKRWRIVKILCLSVDITETEDEEFGVVYAVQFSPESLDF